MIRIRQLALSIWKTEMIDCITSEKLVKVVMQEVENISEKGEESTDFGKEIFETLYFKDTWNYYGQNSRRFILEISFPKYMSKVPSLEPI